MSHHDKDMLVTSPANSPSSFQSRETRWQMTITPAIMSGKTTPLASITALRPNRSMNHANAGVKPPTISDPITDAVPNAVARLDELTLLPIHVRKIG